MEFDQRPGIYNSGYFFVTSDHLSLTSKDRPGDRVRVRVFPYLDPFFATEKSAQTASLS
jgi:hypothetical protein